MRSSSNVMVEPKGSAHLFAALGDETRLRLVSRLCDGGPMSITRLTEGSKITRQAITKHLRVMEESGLVRSKRHGRASGIPSKPDSVTVSMTPSATSSSLKTTSVVGSAE